jgi:hypothetical protein
MVAAATWPDSGLPRVLTTQTAAQLGISRSAVRHAIARRGWRPLARGVVLTAPGEPTREDWILVGMAITGPAAAVSGWDAVRMRGLGSAVPPSPSVLVLDRRGEHRLVGAVRIRPTRRPYRTTLLSGEHPTLPYIPFVHPARALADTALEYRTLPPVRALITSAVQKQLCTPAELAVELTDGPRNNSAPLRRALADAFDGARSIAEAEAIDLLRNAAVPAFEANVPIVDVTGRHLATADLLWRALRAIVEIDSREFHYDDEDWERTLRRHSLLTSQALALTHVTPRRIRKQPRAVVREVETFLRGRAGELGVEYRPGGGPVRHRSGSPPPYALPVVIDRQLWSR